MEKEKVFLFPYAFLVSWWRVILLKNRRKDAATKNNFLERILLKRNWYSIPAAESLPIHNRNSTTSLKSFFHKVSFSRRNNGNYVCSHFLPSQCSGSNLGAVNNPSGKRCLCTAFHKSFWPALLRPRWDVCWPHLESTCRRTDCSI